MSGHQQDLQQKRVLTKIRRQFVSKAKKDEEDQNEVLDPSTRYLSDNNVYMLSAVNGIVEINRKIFIGPQYLNQHLTITNSSVQDKLSSRTVVLSLCSNQDRHHLPSEYTMKRLESYGDLELAAWAHRVMRFQRRYPELMENYLVNRKLDNPAELMNIKEMQSKIREEIENNYLYYKIVKHYYKETTKLSEHSFSEEFIKVMGHSVESFLSWTQTNGLPQVFDHECPVYLNTVKKALDGSLLPGGYIKKGEEHETSIIDKKGQKISVRVQLVCLLEPTQEGFVMNGYFILKNIQSNKCLTGLKGLQVDGCKQKKNEK